MAFKISMYCKLAAKKKKLLKVNRCIYMCWKVRMKITNI